MFVWCGCQCPKRPIAPAENTEWKYKYTAKQRQGSLITGAPAGSSLQLVADPYARKFGAPQRKGGEDLETLPSLPDKSDVKKKRGRKPKQQQQQQQAKGESDDDEKEEEDEEDDDENESE